MVSIEQITAPPSNFERFVAEVSDGMGGLFGPAAADDYRAKAPAQFQSTLSHSAVTCYAARANGETLALALAIRRGEFVFIPFIHVLHEVTEPEVDRALVNALLDTVEAGRPRAILCEFVPFYPVTFRQVFDEREFRAVDRTVMVADTAALAESEGTVAPTRSCPPGDRAAAADILARAWAHAGERPFHPEVIDAGSAHQFLETVSNGGYGQCQPAFMRLIDDDGRPAGMVAGAKTAPDVGFILHVAVVPEAQGQGLGATLLRDEARQFLRQGLRLTALGVSLSSPARRLYQRMGFSDAHSITAFARWYGRAPTP